VALTNVIPDSGCLIRHKGVVFGTRIVSAMVWGVGLAKESQSEYMLGLVLRLKKSR
jgi:hypothetical protein